MRGEHPATICKTILIPCKELRAEGAATTSNNIRVDRTWIDEGKIVQQVLSVTATEIVCIMNNSYRPHLHDLYGVIYKPISGKDLAEKREWFTVIQAVMLGKSAQLTQATCNVLDNTQLADKLACFITPKGFVDCDGKKILEKWVANLKKDGIPYADFQNPHIRCTSMVIAWQLEKLASKPTRSADETLLGLWAISNAVFFTASRYFSRKRIAAPNQRLLTFHLNRQIMKDIKKMNFNDFVLSTFEKV